MLTLEEYEKLNPRREVMHEGIAIVCATPTVFTSWRVASLLEKEPITISWIAEFARDARRVGATGDKNAQRDSPLNHITVASPRQIEQRQPAARPAPPVANLSF